MQLCFIEAAKEVNFEWDSCNTTATSRTGIIREDYFHHYSLYSLVDLFLVEDVLQMMGRAGRPQFDTEGKAVIMVQDTKKVFYKRFLYEPFPVESCLLQVLPDHLNAEIVAGTIGSMQEALDYLTWTFFFRRLMVNPRLVAPMII